MTNQWLVDPSLSRLQIPREYNRVDELFWTNQWSFGEVVELGVIIMIVFLSLAVLKQARHNWNTTREYGSSNELPRGLPDSTIRTPCDAP